MQTVPLCVKYAPPCGSDAPWADVLLAGTNVPGGQSHARLGRDALYLKLNRKARRPVVPLQEHDTDARQRSAARRYARRRARQLQVSPAAIGGRQAKPVQVRRR